VDPAISDNWTIGPTSPGLATQVMNDKGTLSFTNPEYQSSGVTANKPPLDVDNIAGEID